MRALIGIIAACCFSSAATAQAPLHISLHDRAQVRAAVRAVTREPILDITPVYASHPVPSSIRQETVEVRIEHGNVVNKPTVICERTDQVSVRTGSDANLKGGSYSVGRVGTTWKVIGKSFWIH